MEIPQIKDKLTARAFAVYAAIKTPFDILNDKVVVDTIKAAKIIEKYILGDTELPEVAEDPTKSWLETMKSIQEQSFKEEKEKRDKDWEDFKKAFPIIDNSVNSESNEADTSKL